MFLLTLPFLQIQLAGLPVYLLEFLGLHVKMNSDHLPADYRAAQGDDAHIVSCCGFYHFCIFLSQLLTKPYPKQVFNMLFKTSVALVSALAVASIAAPAPSVQDNAVQSMLKRTPNF